MQKINIIWVDDEIEMLKPYIIYLEEKGFGIQTANNGDDAIKIIMKFKNSIDIIFLDENMPGKSGLVVLEEINKLVPNIPVVMITKNEQENIMEDAIGLKIADYLIKPVNPNQILLAIKKNVQNKSLQKDKAGSLYQAEFNKLQQKITFASTYNDWIEIYKEITFWDMELNKTENKEMIEMILMQKTEANSNFAKFIKSNYAKWFKDKDCDAPLLSPNIFKQKVFPLLEKKKKVAFILIDNLRYDQWKELEEIITQFYNVEEENLYYSILPTVTQYSRNSIFAGLMPLEIHKIFPDIWTSENEEDSQNQYEKELLERQINRLYQKITFQYFKVLNISQGKRVLNSIQSIINNDLTAIVYNFVDILSHAKTDNKMVKELTTTESAYRSITKIWFENSYLLETMEMLANNKIDIVLTTDHGSKYVQNPIKVVGDKNTTNNLRYKQGKALSYNKKEVFEILAPEEFHLPQTNISSKYIFATNSDFFVYPNNYNQFATMYKNTLQHGGISIEEMILPIITLLHK